MTKRLRGDVSIAMPAKLAPFLLLTLVFAACGSAKPTHADPRALAAAVTRAGYKTQLVDTHGIELAVPAAWRLNRQQCGTPTENTVLWLENGMTQCLIRQKPGLSVVEFGGGLSHAASWYPRHAKPLVIPGARGWVSGDTRGSHRIEVVFPRRHISVTVFGPRASLVRQIFASLRTIQANKRGCPTRAPSGGYRLGSRPRSGQSFIPPGATRLVGCYYDGQWLDDSSSVRSHAARRVAKVMNNAQYGFSRAPRGTIARSECAPSWHAFSVAYFKYAKRPPVAVTVHPDGCTRLGASNGKWGVRMSHAWVPTFWRNVAYNGSISDVWAA